MPYGGVRPGLAAAWGLVSRHAGATYAAKLLGLALGYYAAAKAGLALAYENSSVTAVWAPTGIALAALVLWGRTLWPGVALGAFLANSWTGVPFITVLGITAGNTLEALVGATLLARVARFRPSLERSYDVLALALAGSLSTMVSATVGVASLRAGGSVPADTLMSTWRTWWLGDLGGDLLVAPFLMVFAVGLRAPRRLRRPRRLFEAACLLACLVGVTCFVFTSSAPLTFLIFPVLIWAALRFGQRGVAAGSLVVAGIAAGFTANGIGPFVQATPDASLLLSQMFVGISALVSLLLAAITSERERAQQALRSAHGELQYLADHDPLTGLLNRRSFERELDSHLERGRRYGLGGAALVLDLDHFKDVNDSLGHHTGDELLVRVAHALHGRLRETDVLARLGGDEYAVLLPRADAAGVRKVTQDLAAAVRELTVQTRDGRRRTVTASLGVAMIDEEALTAEDIMVNADLAMYDAKEAGRDRVVIHGSDEYAHARMKGRLTWHDRIRRALEEDRFTLLAQPIVELASGRASHYELLVRMEDQTGDLIPPAAFLYTAERLNLVQEIDRWVVSCAIAMLERHQRLGRALTLEVNLSGRSLGDPQLLELIVAGLRRTEIPPRRLIFEVTETTAVANMAAARSFGHRLSELGCRFALDDFGAGFGSFYYLKHLPFDFLKIDGEFVRNCRASATDRLLIRAVVDIAKGLGKETVAETVGDDATVELLARLGVDYGQGYHLGPPGPVDEVLADAPEEPAARPAP
jgi:diguanylate cyclase (GGDEF)-like protein